MHPSRVFSLLVWYILGGHVVVNAEITWEMADMAESEEEDFLAEDPNSDCENFLDDEPEAPVPAERDDQLVAVAPPPMSLAKLANSAGGGHIRKGRYGQVLTKQQLSSVRNGTAKFSDLSTGNYGKLATMMFAPGNNYMSNRCIAKLVSQKATKTSDNRCAIANVMWKVAHFATNSIITDVCNATKKTDLLPGEARLQPLVLLRKRKYDFAKEWLVTKNVRALPSIAGSSGQYAVSMKAPTNVFDIKVEYTMALRKRQVGQRDQVRYVKLAVPTIPIPAGSLSTKCFDDVCSIINKLSTILYFRFSSCS